MGVAHHLLGLTALILLLVSGCQKSRVLKTKRGMVVELGPLRVTELREIPWRVGRGATKQRISKGFTAAIDLPEIDREGLLDLYEMKGVDSWVVRIERNTPRQGREVVGHFMVPLRVQTLKGLRVSSGNRARFRMYYAAASVNPRFKLFTCPAFDHNLKVNDLRVLETGIAQDSFVVRRMSMLPVKVESAGFVSLEFNGGMRLRGDYAIAVALYNSNSRVLMSEYIPLRDTISIAHETAVAVEGCGGVGIPEQRKESKQRTFFRGINTR